MGQAFELGNNNLVGGAEWGGATLLTSSLLGDWSPPFHPSFEIQWPLPVLFVIATRLLWVEHPTYSPDNGK